MEKTLLTENLENLSGAIDWITKEDYTNYSKANIVSLINHLSYDVARLTASFKVRLLHIIEVVHNTEIDTERIANIDWYCVYKTIYMTISYCTGMHFRYTIDTKLLNATDENIVKNKDLVVLLNR